MNHRLGEIEARPPGEHAASAPPRPAAEAVSLSPPGSSPEATALDSARAEFRAAWQAKQERAERVRHLAQTLGVVRALTVMLVVLVLLITTGIAWVTMLTECFDLSLVWVPALGIAGCRAVGTLVAWVRTRLNWYADQMEADEVRYL